MLHISEEKIGLVGSSAFTDGDVDSINCNTNEVSEDIHIDGDVHESILTRYDMSEIENSMYL